MEHTHLHVPIARVFLQQFTGLLDLVNQLIHIHFHAVRDLVHLLEP